MSPVVMLQGVFGSQRSRAFLLVLPLACFACSHVRVTTSDGTDVIGRTMELGGISGEANLLEPPMGASPDNPPDYRVIVHPRGERWSRSLCRGAHPFVVKRGFVSVDAPFGYFHYVMAGDGMNEDGLTISAHTLRQALYQNDVLEASGAETKVCFFDLVPWALAQFQKVGELVDALHNVSVIATIPVRLPPGDRLHWAVEDAHGGRLVLEYLEGKLHVHQNRLGVMTNDPDYTWHLRNINNYAAIHAADPDPHGMAVDTREVGEVPSVIGHGFNLFGLPGDLSPASRFIKLFYLRSLAEKNRGKARTLAEGIQVTTGLLNDVWITKGTVALNGGDKPGQFEFTQYSVIKIPQKRQYLWRSYDNAQWRRVDLTRLGFDKRLSTKVYDGEDGILDATDKLLPSEGRSQGSEALLQV